MTPAVALAFWRRVHAKAASMQPDVARAYLAGVAALQDRLSGRELNALIAAGAVDRFLTLALSDANLNAAFSRYRAQIQLTTRSAIAYVGKTIPKTTFADPYKLTIAFDYLNPRVIDALRALDTRVMARLSTDVRETVRAIIENGLRDGANPRATSKAIREMIGLGPTQLEEVANFRAALEGGMRVGVYKDALSYEARDKRFDGTLRRIMRDGGKLTPEQIDNMVGRYMDRRIAINAATTTRTATLESFKTGQRLSWEDAIDKGIVDGGRLMRRWVTVMDGREREEHGAMNGEVTGFDEPYSNGDMVIGEGSPWNCRCVDAVFIGRE